MLPWLAVGWFNRFITHDPRLLVLILNLVFSGFSLLCVQMGDSSVDSQVGKLVVEYCRREQDLSHSRLLRVFLEQGRPSVALGGIFVAGGSLGFH